MAPPPVLPAVSPAAGAIAQLQAMGFADVEAIKLWNNLLADSPALKQLFVTGREIFLNLLLSLTVTTNWGMARFHSHSP
jgi:hypothetical protein